MHQGGVAVDQLYVAHVAVNGVRSNPTRQNKPRWQITDSNGTEWTTWDSSVALAAGNLQGQLAMMTVEVSPWERGMNYTLKNIAPAPVGSQPSPPLGGAPAPAQVPQQAHVTQFAPPSNGQVPVSDAALTAAGVQAAPGKSYGQGGTFTDADVERMSRSTAAEAAIKSASVYNEDGSLDFEKFYQLAEAISKFILRRRHVGLDQKDIRGPNATGQQIVAEVNAAMGAETVQVGAPAPPQIAPQETAQADPSAQGALEWD